MNEFIERRRMLIASAASSVSLLPYTVGISDFQKYGFAPTNGYANIEGGHLTFTPFLGTSNSQLRIYLPYDFSTLKILRGLEDWRTIIIHIRGAVISSRVQISLYNETQERIMSTGSGTFDGEGALDTILNRPEGNYSKGDRMSVLIIYSENFGHISIDTIEMQ